MTLLMTTQLTSQIGNLQSQMILGPLGVIIVKTVSVQELMANGMIEIVANPVLTFAVDLGVKFSTLMKVTLVALTEHTTLTFWKLIKTMGTPLCI